MSFVNNPKNFIYVKGSLKQRQNKVGSDHSSAALLENALGDDKISSLKLGSRLGILSATEPLFKNFVAKASTEIVKGEKTAFVKSKLFGRLTRKLGDLPFYA